MIKPPDGKAASRAPLRPLPDAALVHVTGGSSPPIDVETRMREIVHVQAHS